MIRSAMMDKTSTIFNNKIPNKTIREANKKQHAYLKEFGDDRNTQYTLTAVKNPILYDDLAIMNLFNNTDGSPIDSKKGIIVGNIRMGFGHYRIAIAVASVVKHYGFIPYWFDINGFSDTTAGKIVEKLNQLYSLGSRLSQKYALFNKFFWEPLNYEGFKKLTYNAVDQKVAELFAPLCASFEKTMPFIATHAWPAQAALHAGMTNVINMIPDNWPMALHLAEGAIHTVQSPSSYLGYRILREMKSPKELSVPMPSNAIKMVGHYIDHELVANLEHDTDARFKRITKKLPRRVLISIGGAGAQFELNARLIEEIVPLINEGTSALYVNCGDHVAVLDKVMNLLEKLNLADITQHHKNNWLETVQFCKKALTETVTGVHVFYNENKFAAVYATNLLMRSTDVLITKPSELAFYPVPKLFIQRVGGHERWGAIRAAELGDATYELENIECAAQVLKLMLTEDDLLSLYNEQILLNHKAGIYNGCYRIGDMALGKR